MWLSSADVLPLAGYPTTHARAGEAVAYAETLIAKRTGLTFGQSQQQTLRVSLSSNSFYLPVPADVTSVQSVLPALTDTTFYLERNRVYFESSGKAKIIPGGRYNLQVTRGITAWGMDINKIASLLAAHYLALSDPDRSRFAGTSQGDFSGTFAYTELPVPEAEQMIQPYLNRIDLDVV